MQRILKRFLAQQKSATVSQAPTKLKKFWTSVDVQEFNSGFQIMLDQRSLKTQAGNTVLIPENRKTLAILTAAEWDSQQEYLRSYSLPLVTFLTDIDSNEGHGL